MNWEPQQHEAAFQEVKQTITKQRQFERTPSVPETQVTFGNASFNKQRRNQTGSATERSQPHACLVTACDTLHLLALPCVACNNIELLHKVYAALEQHKKHVHIVEASGIRFDPSEASEQRSTGRGNFLYPLTYLFVCL